MKKYFVLLFFFSYVSLAENYSVNLSWIYREKKPSETYIFPEKHRGVTLMDRFKDWIDKTANNPINLWYDSQFVTAQQLEATKKLLDTINHDRKGKDAIKMMDIRDLKEVRFWDEDAHGDARIFRDTPVYFRSDITRIIATLETLERCTETCYYVYSDFDVHALNEQQLFDDDTRSKLADFGIVFKEGGASYNMENLFHIVSSKENHLLQAMDDVLVQLNILRAQKALNNKDRNLPSDFISLDGLKEIIYSSIPFMFRYFYHKKGFGKLTAGEDVDPNFTSINYRGITNTLKQYYYIYQDYRYNFTILNDKIRDKNFKTMMMIPTKPGIKAAPVSLDYY